MLKPGRPLHKHKESILEYTELIAFSDSFGWTPEQIRALEDKDKLAYQSLLKGRAQAIQMENK